MRQSGKRVFANIGPDNYTMWTKILVCDAKDAEKGSDEIKTYLSPETGITGLLLRNFEPAVVIID